jgi:hypothetical protein
MGDAHNQYDSGASFQALEVLAFSGVRLDFWRYFT